MPDEVTFFDLVSLVKIKPGITVERYGGLINSSFFDGARVLGTLQQKKLITLSTAMPDQNPITVTDTGKQLIAEADSKAEQDFDHLDLEILTQIQKGKNTPEDLGAAVNVRPRDLAMHLYRLSKTDYATYELVNGTVSMMLTEKGFAQTKAGMPMKPQPAPSAVMGQSTVTKSIMMQPPEMLGQKQQGTPPAPPQPQPQPSGMKPTAPMPPKMEGGAMPEKKKGHKLLYILIVIIIIIIIAAGYAYYAHLISI